MRRALPLLLLVSSTGFAGSLSGGAGWGVTQIGTPGTEHFVFCRAEGCPATR